MATPILTYGNERNIVLANDKGNRYKIRRRADQLNDFDIYMKDFRLQFSILLLYRLYDSS